MKVTVYISDNCSNCTVTLDWLNKNSIPADVIDVTNKPNQRKALKDENWTQLPVVKVTENGIRVTDWDGGLTIENSNWLLKTHLAHQFKHPPTFL